MDLDRKLKVYFEEYKTDIIEIRLTDNVNLFIQKHNGGLCIELTKGCDSVSLGGLAQDITLDDYVEDIEGIAKKYIIDNYFIERK